MEVLSGIKEIEIFEKFSDRLSAFPDRPIPSDAYVLAARLFNLCRGIGIQGSNTDFLICACAIQWNVPILSKDKDYLLYKKHIPIDLIEPRKR